MNPASLAGHIIELLKESDRQKEPVDHLAGRYFRERKYCGSHDRRYISDALFGIIRNRRFLEALLEEFIACHPHTGEMDAPQVRHLPILTAYLTLFVPDQPALPESYWKSYFPSIESAEFTKWIAGHRDLGFLPDDRTIRLGVEYSFQDWMVGHLAAAVADETEPLLQIMNTPAPITLRVNTLKTTADRCRERLLAEGIGTETTRYSPDALVAGRRFQSQSSPAFREGWFELQDEGSQLITQIAGPKPGQTVIDAAAGGGGKSLHFAALMRNEGECIAVDIDARRMHALSSRAERAGASIIRTMTTDEFRNGGMNGKADIVLVDAPCSGSGTIRRSPWLKWTIRESDLHQIVRRQKEMLHDNAAVVRPGGKLIYSTCSLLTTENEDVVKSFLEDHPGFIPAPVHVPGTPETSVSSGWVTLYPHRLGTDGFFIAVLQKCV